VSAETRTTSSTGGQKGVKIERYDLIPVGPLRALAVHFGKGARKYDDGQWRKGYEWSKTLSALMRHLEAFREGLDYDVCSNDPEGCSFVTAKGVTYEPVEDDTCYNHTGSHHLDAVMWHSFVLREFTDTHPEHDDRHSTVLRREAEEAKKAELAAEMERWKRDTIWTIPGEAKFGIFNFQPGPEWVDLGYLDADPGVTSDEATRLTWSDETMVIELTDVSADAMRLLCGLPIAEPARFVVGEETEDHEWERPSTEAIRAVNDLLNRR
jgi:hypothetical protein